jgi:hypothetical protein
MDDEPLDMPEDEEELKRLAMEALASPEARRVLGPRLDTIQAALATMVAEEGQR